METEGLVPTIIVLALGAGALGGADALRILLDLEGQSPLVDIAICIFVIAMVTSPVLGTMLMARFVLKEHASTGAGAGSGALGASATDCFAKMTLLVSLAVAFLVTACLVVATAGMDSLRLLADIAEKRPIVAVLVIGAAAVLPCTMALLRNIREADNANGAADGARATESFITRTQTVHVAGLSLIAVGVLAVPFVAPGRLDALRLFPGFINIRDAIAIAIATATVVATVLLVRVSRRASNAAGGGGGAAPTPGTDTGRVARLTQVAPLAVVSFTLACLLVVIPYAQPKRESNGGKHAGSI